MNAFEAGLAAIQRAIMNPFVAEPLKPGPFWIANLTLIIGGFIIGLPLGLIPEPITAISLSVIIGLFHYLIVANTIAGRSKDSGQRPAKNVGLFIIMQVISLICVAFLSAATYAFILASNESVSLSIKMVIGAGVGFIGMLITGIWLLINMLKPSLVRPAAPLLSATEHDAQNSELLSHD